MIERIYRCWACRSDYVKSYDFNKDLICPKCSGSLEHIKTRDVITEIKVIWDALDGKRCDAAHKEGGHAGEAQRVVEDSQSSVA